MHPWRDLMIDYTNYSGTTVTSFCKPIPYSLNSCRGKLLLLGALYNDVGCHKCQLCCHSINNVCIDVIFDVP